MKKFEKKINLKSFLNAIFNNQKKCRLCNNIYLKKIFSFSKIPISEKYVSKSKKIEKN